MKRDSWTSKDSLRAEGLIPASELEGVRGRLETLMEYLRENNFPLARKDVVNRGVKEALATLVRLMKQD